MAEYFGRGLAPATRRSYGAAKRRYVVFCGELGRPPLPASEQRFCHYVAYLVREGLVHSSIKCYLSAVRHLHVEAGIGDLGIASMLKLEQVLRGIKRSQVGKGRKAQQRKPMSMELLEVLRVSWSKTPGEQDAKMLWAAATLCFFGFLRSGELTIPSEGGFNEGAHLEFGDISTDSLEKPSLLRVRIKASKTDQERKGCTLVVGSTGGAACPVAAVLSFIAARGSQRGPLFRYQMGRPLTRTRFVAEVRAALERAGWDSSGYSGHSFRIGAATTAAQEGIGDAIIQRLGKWSSGAYRGYIQPPREHLAGISRVMAKGNSKAPTND